VAPVTTPTEAPVAERPTSLSMDVKQADQSTSLERNGRGEGFSRFLTPKTLRILLR
jgi:hypothetical protein